MSSTETILTMISPAYNAPLDEALHEKILKARSTMIELEKIKSDSIPVPEGAKAILEEMLSLEKDVCSFAAFMTYCEETSHAYMLNDDPEKGLEYAASALSCAQVLGRGEAQAELFGLLFKIAVFANNFQMAMSFLEQKKDMGPLGPEMDEVYESLEAVIENGLTPQPRFQIKGEELPITPEVMALLEGGPGEMAARFVRRATGMTLPEARLEVEKLTAAQLNTMFGL